jgi:oxygen-independent coproporphyrinogen-3 oxidase
VARHLQPGRLALPAPPPLALYVHLPWCLRKCPYCDFNSHEHAREDLPEDRYVDALMADLEAALPLVWGRPVLSVFIGGGTPSLFSPAAIGRLIDGLRARLPLVPGAEITLEANPGTFETDRFRAFRAAGVTRLSVGVQSFDDARLAALGRVHDRAQAEAALREAAEVFETWNLDLMYALPAAAGRAPQTVAELERELAHALSFTPPHLSVYHLTLEPNTVFAKYPPVVPDDDTAFEMLDRLTALTAAAGLQRYEVSAYARPGHRCTHNQNYWQFGDYLGIGAGAHGKLSFAHRIVRQTRVKDPRSYMERALATPGGAVSSDEEVAARDLPFEFMLNALRLREGFDLALFQERCGLAPSVLGPALDEAERRGLLAREGVAGQWLRPTDRGIDFLSDLQSLFLAD